MGWDTKLDIDSSVIMMDRNGGIVDVVWYCNKRSKCGSITHSGDDRTGEGSGDDETIFIRLSTVP